MSLPACNAMLWALPATGPAIAAIIRVERSLYGVQGTPRSRGREFICDMSLIGLLYVLSYRVFLCRTAKT